MKHLHTLFLTCTLICATAQAQPFVLPPLDSLFQSVDAYFAANAEAQLLELQQQSKYRWLNYLPNPGYNPFTGGFNLSFNVASPLAEIKQAHTARQKAKSIQRLNELEAVKTKNAVAAAHFAVQQMQAAYIAQDSLERIKAIAFDLYSKQYIRNEMLPSEYLQKQQERLQFAYNRLQQRQAIDAAIHQLYIMAFYPLTHTQKTSHHDQSPVAQIGIGGANY